MDWTESQRPTSRRHYWCTCCWIVLDATKYQLVQDEGSCVCANEFCDVCKRCAKHCKCSTAMKAFHRTAVELRGVALATERADFVERYKKAYVSECAKRDARRALRKITRADCILLWELGIRADEDIANALT